MAMRVQTGRAGAAALRGAPLGLTPLRRGPIRRGATSQRGSRYICHAGEDNKVDSLLAASAQQVESTVGADAAPAAAYPGGYPQAYTYGPPPTAEQQAQYQAVQGSADGRQYYAQPPPGYYPYAPPPAEKASSAGPPWFIWVGVGMVAAFVLGKVQELVKKGPQQMMTEMMMKQAMGAMGSKGGASPFGAPPGGMPPFPGAPGASPFGAGSPFAAAAAGAAAPASTPVDVSPTPAATTVAQPSSKFAENKAKTDTDAKKTESTKDTKTSDTKEVVEPSMVKEPTGDSSSSSSEKKSAFFTDVSDTAAKAAAESANTFASGNGAAAGAPPGFGAGAAAGGGASAGAGSAGGEASDSMMQMMETMLRNPEMQKMLYPYLPEPMRNPSSIEWMLSNPEVKQQMAQMFEQQNMMSPQMMDMMKGMDFNQDKVNQQFSELGLKPEDVISKVMSTPDLASGFSNPKVQAAIIDISQNPMNIMKYQEDPEIMTVLEKVTEVFQPGGGMPGMPTPPTPPPTEANK